MNPLTQFKKARILPVLIALALVVVGALIVVPALTTPPVGVTTEIIGVGSLDEIDASAKTDIDPGPGTHFWKALIDTKGVSDLHVLRNTIVPGGTFGWHRHPGPSLVIVKSGTATFYWATIRPARPTWCQPDQGSSMRVVTCTSSGTRATSTS